MKNLKQSHLINNLEAFKNDYHWYCDNNDNNTIEMALDIINQILDISSIESLALESEESESMLLDVSLWEVLKYYLDGGFNLNDILNKFKGGYISINYDIDSGMYVLFTPIY